MRLSVILSTYNAPSSLRRALWSLEFQTWRDFEVVIADDGSGPETAAVIDEIRRTTFMTVRHVWQPDEGFRKNTVLNLAVRASTGEYLVFLDGDCVARKDLLATHVSRARPQQTLSAGSQIDLPRHVHQELTREAIARGRPFDARWLRERRVELAEGRYTDKYFRIGCRPAYAHWLDRLFPRTGFIGCNSSAWKCDILGVNGFDEEIAYGVDDKDLGVRLINAGVVSRRLKYSLVYLHLEHDRAYADAATIERNKELVRRRRREGVTWIATGMSQDGRQAA